MTAAAHPILSVIIVAYKSRSEIGACLGSIPGELAGRAVEVVVVDNSLGADGVPGLIAERFPWMRCIVPEENLGFGRGNNRGFAATTGEYVLFLNPDTEVNADALAHCLERLREDSGIGLISPKLVQPDGTMDLACRRSIPTLWDGFCRACGLAAAFPKTALFSGYNLTHLPVDGTYEVGAINGAFMMGGRAVFERIAEPAPSAVFDERFFMYGDDLDLCIRMRKAGFRIVYDGRQQIIHLKGMSVARDFDRMSTAIFDANRDVYLKHFNPENSRFIEWKYLIAFGLWKRVALLRAKVRGYRRVRPV